jgi:hypothetical protein
LAPGYSPDRNNEEKSDDGHAQSEVKEDFR